MKSLVRASVLLLATVAAPAAAHAQCADGSPPPCAAAVRRAAVRSAAPDIRVRRRSFLVLPFRNVSRAAEHDWLVEGSPVLIGDALSRNDSVAVVPDERLYPALKRAGLTAGGVMDLSRVRRVADETGGWTAVTGEILSLGNRLRVSARAFDVVSNAEVLRAVEEAAPGEDVREVYQRLGTKLMKVAGLGAPAADLATTTTRSLDAYRAYVRGVTHANRSEAKQARDAFREAVRLDSTYAQAYLKLAEAELNVAPAQMMNLQAPVYRYASRAAELSGNLPPRDRELVLAINDLLSGRLGLARTRLTRLLEEDSLNVDAIEWRASLEFFDPILVPVPGGERPRGSLNRGLALAKRALELDPSRHQLYGNLVQMYLLVGGGTPGIVMGHHKEAASLPALLNTNPAAVFVPLLKDTVVLVPRDSLAAIPSDSITAARARAVDAARQWVQRWLVVGRGQAEPHLWASRAHAMAGDFAAALRELESADSLGVETGLENVPARRMSLLAQLRRYEEGSRIADSLWKAGALEASAVTAYQVEGMGWAYTLFVLNGQYDRAATIVERFATVLAPAAVMNPEVPADALATAFMTGGVTQFFKPPVSVRVTAYDRLLDDAATLPRAGVMTRMLPFHARILASDTSVSRRALAQRMKAAAARLAVAGNVDIAYQLAAEASRDSIVRRELDSLPWYTERRRAARAVRVESQMRFKPVRAVVTDSTAVFGWTVQGEDFTWHRLETRVGEEDFLWRVDFKIGDAEYELVADVSRRPGSTPVTGKLKDLLGLSSNQVHQIVSPDTTVQHRVLSRTAMKVEPEPGGFRMVLRDRAILSAWRREKPPTVRMRFRPCVPATEEPSSKCVDEQIAVVYPAP